MGQDEGPQGPERKDDIALFSMRMVHHVGLWIVKAWGNFFSLLNSNSAAVRASGSYRMYIVACVVGLYSQSCGRCTEDCACLVTNLQGQG